MKVLMLLSSPFTEDSRVYNEATSLIRAGHHITVLGWDRKGQYPEKGSWDGISIRRTRNTGFMNLLPYDIFRLSRWWKQAEKKALLLHRTDNFDAIHCHDLDTLPIGIGLKKRLGIPLIYDAHEIWGYMVARDLPKWWANKFLRLEKKLAPTTDKVITVGEPCERYFKDLGCEDITLIRNCKRPADDEYSPPRNDVFTLTFIGTLNDSRFVKEAIRAIASLEGIHFKIAGYGSIEKDVRTMAESSNGSVEFLGRMPMDDVITETMNSDAILCMLRPDNKNNQIGLPNKVFEAMVSGRPVIATKGTYSGELIEKLDMGIAIEYDENSFIEALTLLRDDPARREEMGKNAREASRGEYNWETQERRLLAVYETIAGRK